MIRSLHGNFERVPGARRRWMLLVIAWLSVFSAPCAIAFGDDTGCVHAAGGGHVHDGGGHADHGSQPSADCAKSDCCDSPDAALDARPGKCDADEAGNFILAPGYTELVSIGHRPATSVDRPPPEPGYSAPPLNILNCVYLD